MPRAQAAATYTFSRIAEDGFPQVVAGDGLGPVPQTINRQSPSINDDGVVAFGHSAPSGRSVISMGDGRTVVQVYGGGILTPANDRTGIDGDGGVYLVENVTANTGPTAGWPCGVGVFGGCLFNSNRTVGLPTTRSFFLVNGAHPRLRLPVASDRVAYQLDSAGLQLLTETDLVAEDSLFLNQFDINTSGEVVFLTSSGIVAARAGQPVRVVLPSSTGFAPRSPRIDDTGRVFFSGSEQGEQRWNVYRVDPGSQEPIKLIDGNNGPLRLTDTAAVAVNGAGSLVFIAERGLNGPRGIYTGPDPNSNTVIEVGDVLDGRTVVDLHLNPRALNNNGLDGLGQIVFAARLFGDSGFSVYRADPTGTSSDNPLVPAVKVLDPVFEFARIVLPAKGGTVTYWDPPVAIGYEYRLAAGDPNFESVLLPAFPTHDSYELHMWHGTEYVLDTTLRGDVEHVFGLGGVDRFRIMGIPESLGLDVENPLAFVTGFRFVGPGSVELTMTPLTAMGTTAPTTSISLTPNMPDGQSGWYRSPVHVTVSANSEDADVAEIRCVLDPANPPVAFDDLPSSCSFTGIGAAVSVDGLHTIYAASRGPSGQTESIRSVSLKIDGTGPGVACEIPSVFALNETNATISASLTDAGSGPVAQTVTTSVITSGVGVNSVLVTGFDEAGNSTTVSCTYRVEYRFIGFSAPIENDGVLNVVKAGRGLPLKWQLLDANGQPSMTLTGGAISVQSLACPVGTTEDQIEETVSGESGLQNLGGGYYQLNWKTPVDYAKSCKTLRLDLGEGMYRTALFKFTR